MEGFKDTTKTRYFKGGPVKGPKGAAKVSKVMHEFKSGNLKSSSGDKVTNPKQGIAIALSEARNAQKKACGGGVVKKAKGGSIPVATVKKLIAPKPKPKHKTNPAKVAQERALVQQLSGAAQAAQAGPPQAGPPLGGPPMGAPPVGGPPQQPGGMKKGGKVKKASGGRVKKAVGGGIPTINDLNRANRDVGGADGPAMAATVARGNRDQALEAGDEGVLSTPSLQVRRPKGVPAYTPDPMVPQTPLQRTLGTLPSQRGQMRRP